jgi:hypothetical protein
MIGRLDSLSARFWRNLLFAGTAITVLVYLWLARGGFAVQDDGRQFLLWMPRLRDPALLNGDLMADYWQSVSPLLYRVPFQAVAALGIDPVVFGKFLAIPLLLLSAFAAWKLARALTPSPLTAFVAAAFTMGFILHEDSIYTASPRAFSHPLLLLFFLGLVRDRWPVILGSLFLLAALYPAPALVALTVLGLSRIQVKPFAIDWSKRSLLVTGAAGVLVGLAFLPFLLQTGPWGPTLTLEQARHLPNLMTPGGRSSIVDSAGNLGWHCSGRLGFLPALVPCDFGIPGATLWNLLLFGPYLWLAWQALHGRAHRLWVLTLIAAAIWYAIAATVAFKLHLPGRYSQRILEVLQFLALGHLLGAWLERRLALPPTTGTRIGAGAIALFLIVSFLTPVPDMRRPDDPALIRRIAALPATARFAGISEDLNFVPVLTGRSVLATPEHAIPYQLGYYTRINERLAASLAAVSTPDVSELRAIVTKYRIDYLLVERDTLASGTLPGRYPSLLQAESALAEARLRAGRPAIVARPECLRHAGAKTLMIDARCAAR